MKQVADGQKNTEEKKLNCEIHGEYWGFVMTINGEKIKGACPACIEDERLQELREIAKGYTARKRIDVFNQSCVPKRFQSCTFTGYDPVCEDAENVKELLSRYVQNFEKVMKNGTSFLFSGGTGTGKTTLAAAVLNNIMHRGNTGVYISSMKFISTVKRTWVKGSEMSQDEAIEKYVNFDLLVLDEIGKGIYSAKEKEAIFFLLDRRYEEGRPTIGISIHNKEKVGQIIDKDAIRRLTTGGGGVLEFGWEDYEKTTKRF